MSRSVLASRDTLVSRRSADPSACPVRNALHRSPASITDAVILVRERAALVPFVRLSITVPFAPVLRDTRAIRSPDVAFHPVSRFGPILNAKQLFLKTAVPGFQVFTLFA